MKLKNLAKGLLVTAALAVAVVVAPMPSVKAQEGQTTYTVERNDYLRKIAKKVYGDAELWKVIYEANSGVIKKKDYIIYTGQVLIIPTINGNAAVTPVPAAPVPDTTVPVPDTTTPVPGAGSGSGASASEGTTPAPEVQEPSTPTPAPGLDPNLDWGEG